MTVEPMEIRIALEARGVELEKPADDAKLNEFERGLRLSLDNFYRGIYSQFNGFHLCDQRSHICLWQMQRIYDERALSLEKDGNNYFAAGDFLIDSDILMFCLSREDIPILFLYERKELASTAREFFTKLISGQFDVLQQLR
jgi:hypothetical protein